MSHEEEMRQFNELYDLGQAWIGALETESREQDANLQRLRQMEDSFRKVRAQMAEISRIMDNGSENAG